MQEGEKRNDMNIKIKWWLIRVLERWLRKLGWPGWEPVVKTMPAQMVTIEARALLPIGENASKEQLHFALKKSLIDEAFNYANISEEPEEFDLFPCVRARLRVVPFEKNEVKILNVEK